MDPEFAADTHLAVALTQPEPPLAEQAARARAAGADLIELRMDLIGVDPVRALLSELAAGRGPGRLEPRTLIVTLRESDEGGAWAGPLDEKLAVLEALGPLAGYVDFEWALWRAFEPVQRRLARLCGLSAADRRRRPRLILSYHDISATPDDLDDLFDQLAGSPADVLKLAFTAADATDALRVADLLRRRGRERPLIAMAMDPAADDAGAACGAGLASRILARKFGGFLTFAAAQQGPAAAPGQPPLPLLQQRYRWDALDSDTRVYGVVGWPVHHSRSPEIHNAAIAAAGINAVYLPLPVRPDYAAFARFMNLVQQRPELGVAGLSVTLPHKSHALRWLCEHAATAAETAGPAGAPPGARRASVSQRDPLSPLARRCGAVNTLILRDGVWYGDNTDAPAVLAALRSAPALHKVDLRRVQVDVLGAGGVARAVVAGLTGEGCRVTVFNRTRRRAEELAKALGCAAADWDQRLRGVGEDAGAGAEAPAEGGRAALRALVNCTAVGMETNAGQPASPMPMDALGRYRVVFDTIYTPPQTRLLQDAAAVGAQTVSGLQMFLEQAERQHALWHGGAGDAGAARRR